MSWQATAWALAQTTGSPSGKAVLLCLANYADADGCCYPSQKRIAKETEQSIDSVQRRIKTLEDLGLVVRERRIKKRGGWSCDHYFLRIAKKTINATLPQSAVPSGGQAPHLRLDGTAAVRHESLSQSPTKIIPPYPPASTTFKRKNGKGAFQECPLRAAESHSDGENDSAEAYAKVAKAHGAVFVFEGSKPWKAWIAYREAAGVRPVEPPLTTKHCNGKLRRGSFLRGLFPPA